MNYPTSCFTDDVKNAAANNDVQSTFSTIGVNAFMAQLQTYDFTARKLGSRVF